MPYESVAGYLAPLPLYGASNDNVSAWLLVLPPLLLSLFSLPVQYSLPISQCSFSSFRVLCVVQPPRTRESVIFSPFPVNFLYQFSQFLFFFFPVSQYLILQCSLSFSLSSYLPLPFSSSVSCIPVCFLAILSSLPQCKVPPRYIDV